VLGSEAMTRLRTLLVLGAAVLAAACTPAADRGMHDSRLDAQIAGAIGDPSTCVLLQDRKTGQIIYRYGTDFNCVRAMPACDRPGSTSAHDALAFASQPGGRMASCASNADGSRRVGWAEGPVASQKGRDLVYSAVMEGQRALPGHEINARLYDAFGKAGV
jgi:hypothetical protein